MPFTLNCKGVMSATIRATAWLMFAGISFLTLSSPALRLDTGVERSLEHVLAFALVGLTFSFGYPRRRLAIALIGIVIVAALETLQHWVPGRHAYVGDFVLNALGLCGGIAAAAVLQLIASPAKQV
jgi:hypothetical protein